MSKKDADQLVNELRKHFRTVGSGHTIEKRGGHWHVINDRGNSIYRFASTPSDTRFRRNTTADLRRLRLIPGDWR